ncbi:MAG TPA: CorA family divalent cation transporter [Candidatus Limnocylindrales bacterium]|nr:CorA family divalent cation transporter [Candidatus Limnocylindrales bacterium]
MSIEAVLFRGDGSDESIELEGRDEARISKDELLWIDASSLDAAELAIIRRALGLTDRAVAALKARPTAPDATVLDGALEVVVRVLADGAAGDPTTIQVMVGDEWIITHHARPVPFLEERRETIRDDRPVGRLTPVQFLVSVLDWHVDSFFRAAEELETEVDELDDAALGSDRDILARLVDMRGRIAAVRRVMSPHRETFAELARPVFLPDLDPTERDALAGVATRLERAGEAINNTREMLIGTFDVHMTRTAQRTNDIMRVLTLASVVLLPSVVVAGIMGMNFKVPLFENPNLFWVVIGAMLAMAVGTLGIARWRGWL